MTSTTSHEDSWPRNVISNGAMGVQLAVMQWHRQTWLALTVLLSGCGGGGGGGNASSSAAASSSPRPVEQSDLQIASAIYDGGTRTPAGFYTETAPPNYSSVATKHLKNTDVDSSLATSAAQFELCTDDWNEALQWSELAAQRAPQYSNLVATNDDSRFFEFGRVQSGTPEVYVQSRIYKCAYLNRGSADLRSAAGAAGRLNIRPLSADDLRQLAEYFWQFTSYNNFGNVVLKSTGGASGNSTLDHTLHIATLVRGGVSPGCDRIDIIAWRHQLDTSTGNLVLDVRTAWSFGAEESTGTAQLCSH